MQFFHFNWLFDYHVLNQLWTYGIQESNHMKLSRVYGWGSMEWMSQEGANKAPPWLDDEAMSRISRENIKRSREPPYEQKG